MTKEEIIKAIWNELPNLTINESRKIYETNMNLIKGRLSKGEDIELRGFGSFKIREKNEIMGNFLMISTQYLPIMLFGWLAI